MKERHRIRLLTSGFVLLLGGLMLLITGCLNGGQNWRNWPAPQIQMVPVQGGAFGRGLELNPATGWGDTTPVYRITLSNFYMGRYPITQREFNDVMGSSPSRFTFAQSPLAHGETSVLLRPVERVSWYDAIVFANRLSIMRGLIPAYEMQTAGNPNLWSTDPDTWGAVPVSSDTRWNAVRIMAGSTGYRLPTEAQWEFAAKGGNTWEGFTFSGSNTATEVGWINANSGRSTRQVGLLQPNVLGLHDMTGNVWEWVWDWWGTYTAIPAVDPSGASGGPGRVVRGGSRSDDALGARSVVRRWGIPSARWRFLGFRLVRP